MTESTNALSFNNSNENGSFLSNDIKSSNSPSPFLTEDNLPKDRPEPFLSRDTDTENKQSPLEIQRREEKAEAGTQNAFKPKKSIPEILNEMQRNPMHSTMTIQDIVKEYNIPYAQAQEIFREVNADSNGAAREFQVPNNATISYLV